MPTLILQLQFLRMIVIAAGINFQCYTSIRWLLAYRDALAPTAASYLANVNAAVNIINRTGSTKNYDPGFLALMATVLATTLPQIVDIFEKLRVDNKQNWMAADAETLQLIAGLQRVYSGCVETSVWGLGPPDAPFDATAIAGTIANVMGLTGNALSAFLPDENSPDAGITSS